MVAQIHVQTLMEASFVDVIVVIYWTMMEFLVIVCEREIDTCTMLDLCAKKWLFIDFNGSVVM